MLQHRVVSSTRRPAVEDCEPHKNYRGMSKDCPSDAELEQFLCDVLSEDESGHIAIHIDDCPACTARLEAKADYDETAYWRGLQVDTIGQGAPPELRAPDAARQGARRPLPKIRGHELLEVLGKGGMGVVYKARHLRLDRLVAVKMILASAHASEEQTERFLNEARAVARLQHPNILHIFEIGDDDGQSFFSMEYVNGGCPLRHVQGRTPAGAEGGAAGPDAGPGDAACA